MIIISWERDRDTWGKEPLTVSRTTTVLKLLKWNFFFYLFNNFLQFPNEDEDTRRNSSWVELIRFTDTCAFGNSHGHLCGILLLWALQTIWRRKRSNYYSSLTSLLTAFSLWHYSHQIFMLLQLTNSSNLNNYSERRILSQVQSRGVPK